MVYPNFDISDDVLWFENYDLDSIVTPVNATLFERLLKESQCDEDKIQFIANGFRNGFPLKFEGDQNVLRDAENLKLRIGSPTELWNKLMKEVKEKPVARPYHKIPFDTYIQSPIGLVPKDGGTKTRLIFYLSYPKNRMDGESVNAGISKAKCSVQYPMFEDAIKLCLQAGAGCTVRKSDFSTAFRQAPMSRDSWKFLIMKAVCPLDRKTYFFIDKCMPFGASISCAHFQKICDAIAHIWRFKTKKDTVNYLDDFFFAALMKFLCDEQMRIFMQICSEISFPVSIEKHSGVLPS